MSEQKSENEKMTLDKLIQMSRKEFLGIREDIADIRDKMATKDDLENLKADLRLELASKSDLESAKSYIVSEIKEFMRPRIKSLDTVLIDVENLKERIKN